MNDSKNILKFINPETMEVEEVDMANYPAIAEMITTDPTERAKPFNLSSEDFNEEDFEKFANEDFVMT